MNNFKRIALLMVLSCLLTAPIVWAQEPTQDNEQEGRMAAFHERMEKKIAEVYDKLDLTPEQRAKLETNKQNNWSNKKEQMQKMKQLRDQMREELMKENVDQARVEALQEEIKKSQSAMMDERLDAILEVRKILTPAQFEKFDGLMEEQKRKRFERFEKE